MNPSVKQVDGSWHRPGKVSPQYTSPSNLRRLFRLDSVGRREFDQHVTFVKQFTPHPTPYVTWHLARYTRTLQYLDFLVKAKTRWLDIGSDAWFWLLAKQRFPLTVMEPTGMSNEDVTFTDRSNGATHKYSAKALEITNQQTWLGTGQPYDLVTAFEVIEHLPHHPAQFLYGVSKSLRLGGRFVLSTPNIASWSVICRLISGHAPYQTAQYGGPMDHRKEYTTFEMKTLLSSAGFHIEKISTFNCYQNDCCGITSRLFYAGTIAWHCATCQPIPVRNLLVLSGSTMIVSATKVRECDPALIVEV